MRILMGSFFFCVALMGTSVTFAADDAKAEGVKKVTFNISGMD